MNYVVMSIAVDVALLWGMARQFNLYKKREEAGHEDGCTSRILETIRTYPRHEKLAGCALGRFPAMYGESYQITGICLVYRAIEKAGNPNAFHRLYKVCNTHFEIGNNR